MPNLLRTRFLAPAAVCSAALAAMASSASAQSYSILLQDGQNIDGIGNVTSITNITVNNFGHTLIWADPDHATTTADFVLLFNGTLLLREDDSVPPAGANLSSVDDFSLDNAGNWTGNYFLRNTGATTNDSGIYYNNALVLQEGTATVDARLGDEHRPVFVPRLDPLGRARHRRHHRVEELRAGQRRFDLRGGNAVSLRGVADEVGARGLERDRSEVHRRRGGLFRRGFGGHGRVRLRRHRGGR